VDDLPIRILSVERDGDDGLIVTFSDGTTAGYVLEELLELRPQRLLTKDSPAKPRYLPPNSAS